MTMLSVAHNATFKRQQPDNKRGRTDDEIINLLEATRNAKSWHKSMLRARKRAARFRGGLCRDFISRCMTMPHQNGASPRQPQAPAVLS
jgi:hypothetical protein